MAQSIRTQIQFIDTFGQTGPQGYIDVDANSQFAINFSKSDITDPFSKKGTKSYQFNIVGSKEVNQLLNHYYEVNVLDGTYSVNKRQKVAVLRNGLIVADNLYMQLLGVNKITANEPYSATNISYDVIAGDDVTSFFLSITNKELADIDFSDLDHTYTSTEVVNSYGYDYTDGYKYVLPWINNTQYDLEECRPAIAVWQYWNRIHASAGYQWEWTGFDSDAIRMDRLWIPYNGDEPILRDQSQLRVEAELNTPFTRSVSLTALGVPLNIPIGQCILDTETLDPANQYNPVTGVFTSAVNTGNNALNFQFIVDYELKIKTNSTPNDTYIINAVGTDCQMRYRAQIMLGSTALDITDTFLNSPVATPYTIPALGTVTIASGTVTTGIGALTNVQVGDTFTTSTRVTGFQINSAEFLDDTVYANGNLQYVDTILVINSIRMVILPNPAMVSYNTHIYMNDFVPAKIKQSDFVKGIMNMYNLIADTDPTNEKKIIYKTRDDYYDSGALKDWTKLVDISKQQTIQFISNTANKRIVLTYTQDKDDPNVQYQSATNEIYGQLQYTLQNNNIKDQETKSILFSPTPIRNTSFGTFNPLWNGKKPNLNIRILLDGGELPTGNSGSQTYDIIDYVDSSLVPHGTMGISTYPAITHFDNADTPVFDINFGLNDFYYYSPTSTTNNNLFNMFWRRTIGQIDTGKIVTMYLNLKEYDVSSLKLNDKIWIKDAYYNINQMTYDSNSTGTTKVELITIDENLLLPIFRKIHFDGSPVNPSTNIGVSVVNAVVGAVVDSRDQSLNWNYSPGEVFVVGQKNYISPDVKRTLVVGDNQRIENSDSLYAPNAIFQTLTVGNTVVSQLPWIYVGNDIVAQQLGTQPFNIVADPFTTVPSGSATLSFITGFSHSIISDITESIISGRGQSVDHLTDSIIGGKTNTITSGSSSTNQLLLVAGSSNVMDATSGDNIGSIVGGDSNEHHTVINSITAGEVNVLTYVENSLVIGDSNQLTGASITSMVRYSIMTGSSNTVTMTTPGTSTFDSNIVNGTSGIYTADRTNRSNIFSGDFLTVSGTATFSNAIFGSSNTISNDGSATIFSINGIFGAGLNATLNTNATITSNLVAGGNHVITATGVGTTVNNNVIIGGTNTLTATNDIFNNVISGNLNTLTTTNDSVSNNIIFGFNNSIDSVTGCLIFGSNASYVGAGPGGGTFVNNIFVGNSTTLVDNSGTGTNLEYNVVIGTGMNIVPTGVGTGNISGNLIIGGGHNIVNTNPQIVDSFVFGGSNTTPDTIAGGYLGGTGIAETSFGRILWGGKTTSNILEEIFLDGTAMQFKLITATAGSSYRVVLTALVMDQSTTKSTEFTGSGIIRYDGTTTTLPFGITMTPGQDELGMSTSDIIISADTGTNALKVEVQGNGNNLTWSVVAEFIQIRL